MFFSKSNPESAVKVYRREPMVGPPFVVSDKKELDTFYRYDTTMSQIIEGYSESPQNSYTKRLMEKYPLDNE